MEVIMIDVHLRVANDVNPALLAETIRLRRRAGCQATYPQQVKYTSVMSDFGLYKAFDELGIEGAKTKLGR